MFKKKRKEYAPKKEMSVLIIDDIKRDLDEIAKELQRELKQISDTIKFKFYKERVGSEGIKKVEEIPEIQIVILDWVLHDLDPVKRDQDLRQPLDNPLVFKKIKKSRPEILVFILTNREDGAVIMSENPGIEYYFHKDITNCRTWARKISDRINQRTSTPFFEALMEYVEKAHDYFHTPGVSGGDSLSNSPWAEKFFEYYGENYFAAESSSTMPPLDSLLDAQGSIKNAQEAAARAFGSRKTFFITTGTSTSNKIILQSVVRPGEKVLIDRNCHKSMHYAAILSGCIPVYLDTPVNEKYGLFCPASKNEMKQKIIENSDARLLVITSPTFDGLRYDLKDIVKIAHEKRVKVLVDEAWYAFARFHPDFRPTAMEAGSDFATQSTHKTMSAFRQASMIHINYEWPGDPRPFDEQFFMENYHAYMTTSPHYGMIASLDVGRMQMEVEGYRLLTKLLREVDLFRGRVDEKDNISNTGVFHHTDKLVQVVGKEELIPAELMNDQIDQDRTKIVLDVSDTGFSAKEIKNVLMRDHHIQINKYTHNTLLMMCTIGTTHEKFENLKECLRKTIESLKKNADPSQFHIPEMPKTVTLTRRPRDAFFSDFEEVNLLMQDGNINNSLIGRIAVTQVTPYPPGIPVLVPGQEIDEAILMYLNSILKQGIEIHGLDHRTTKIRVIKNTPN